MIREAYVQFNDSRTRARIGRKTKVCRLELEAALLAVDMIARRTRITAGTRGRRRGGVALNSKEAPTMEGEGLKVEKARRSEALNNNGKQSYR